MKPDLNVVYAQYVLGDATKGDVFRAARRMVNSIANKMGRHHHRIEVQDLAQVGYIGVLKAMRFIEQSDSSATRKFSNLAYDYAKWEMVDFIREVTQTNSTRKVSRIEEQPFPIRATEEALEYALDALANYTFEDGVIDAIDTARRMPWVWSQVDSLPPKQKQAIEILYAPGTTGEQGEMTKLAKENGIDPRFLSLNHNRALGNLRKVSE